MPSPFEIRAVNDHEDLAALTEMIHAAYASHASEGLRYWGTHQSVEDTAKRLSSGNAWVVMQGQRYIATATLRPHDPASKMWHYREPDTRILTQFCVCPTMKGQGVGRALHDHVLAFAKARGAKKIVLDTAKPAAKLIAMYEAWCYIKAGECDWRPHTNYESVVLIKTLVE